MRQGRTGSRNWEWRRRRKRRGGRGRLKTEGWEFGVSGVRVCGGGGSSWSGAGNGRARLRLQPSGAARRRLRSTSGAATGSGPPTGRGAEGSRENAGGQPGLRPSEPGRCREPGARPGRQCASRTGRPRCRAPAGCRCYRSKSSSTFSVTGWDWQARTYPASISSGFQGEVAVHADLARDQEGPAGAADAALAGVRARRRGCAAPSPAATRRRWTGQLPERPSRVAVTVLCAGAAAAVAAGAGCRRPRGRSPRGCGRGARRAPRRARSAPWTRP